MTDLVNRLRSAATIPFKEAHRTLFRQSADEIERLQAAKREALKAADGRSKENVALRALGKRAADTIRTLDPFGDHWSERDLRVLAGEPTGEK